MIVKEFRGIGGPCTGGGTVMGLALGGPERARALAVFAAPEGTLVPLASRVLLGSSLGGKLRAA